MNLSFSVDIDDKEILFTYDEEKRSLIVTSINGNPRHIICASGHINNVDDAKEYAKVLSNEFQYSPFWHPV